MIKRITEERPALGTYGYVKIEDSSFNLVIHNSCSMIQDDIYVPLAQRYYLHPGTFAGNFASYYRYVARRRPHSGVEISRAITLFWMQKPDARMLEQFIKGYSANILPCVLREFNRQCP